MNRRVSRVVLKDDLESKHTKGKKKKKGRKKNHFVFLFLKNADLIQHNTTQHNTLGACEDPEDSV